MSDAPPPPPPQSGQATAVHTGKSCPYCRFPLKEGTSIMSCGVCGAAHHADGWSDNANGGAVFACSGGPEAVAAAAAAPAPDAKSAAGAPPPPVPVPAPAP